MVVAVVALNQVAPGSSIDPVVGGSAGQRVAVEAAKQSVIARLAVELVVAGIPENEV